MKKSILFFVNGQATDEEKAFAEKNGMKIRNALAGGEDDFVEPCDGACGAVPESYKKKEIKILDVAVPVREGKAPEGDKRPEKRGAKELAKLVSQAETLDEIEALLEEAGDSKTVKAAAEKRGQELAQAASNGNEEAGNDSGDE